jgi:hypothetical protein
MPRFLSVLTIALLGAGAAAGCGPAGPPAPAEDRGNASPAVGNASATPEVENLVYRGSCDGSAATVIDERHFAAAYDEDNVIRIFPIGGGEASSTLDFGAHLGIGGDESDVEGAARIGTRIYWIGSMGRNDRAEDKPERRRFFATTIAGEGRLALAGDPAAAASEQLFRAIADAPELQRYNLSAAALLATKTAGGLNIEGLASTANGGLIIAFRAPVQPVDPAGDRRAIVVTLVNPEEVIEGRPARFVDAGHIGLGDRGVRSMEFRPAQGDYLILAGAFDEARRFALFRWSGRLADDPVQLNVELEPLNPESLSLLPDGRVLVLSDDGEVQVEGRNCKSGNTPAARRSFRGRILRLG